MSAEPPYEPGRSPAPGWDSGQVSRQSGRSYPQQQLSEQQVQPGTNRRPIYVGSAVAVVLLVVSAVLFTVLRDKGEDTRAEYCAELKDLTNEGDLASAFSTADESSVSRLLTIREIAPDAVADDWTLVSDVVQSGLDGQEPDLPRMLTAFNALRVIAADAKSNCDLDINLPSL